MKILSDVMSFLNPLSQVPALLLGLIGFIVAIVLSVTLLLTVVGRFFKIYLFAALSPIPLSCFGSESTQSVGQNFLRAFAGVSLEGFIVGLAMILFAAYSQAPLIDFGGVGIFQWLGGAADEMAYMYTAESPRRFIRVPKGEYTLRIKSKDGEDKISFSVGGDTSLQKVRAETYLPGIREESGTKLDFTGTLPTSVKIDSLGH